MATACGPALDGLIVPDLPLEESGACDRMASEHGLGMVRLVAPNTPDDRLARLVVASSGFLYAVTVNGAGSSFEHAAPRPILNMRAINFPHAGVDYHTYTASPDGQRFLYYQFVVPVAPAAQSSGLDHPSGLVVAKHWESGLKQ